ncbi:hypothetical protein RFI_30847 [Reticulomyxa filosa]|uniref:Uncharacterized protein n=1 Tax=Reticulomyxa filosa TaxID=46433 RepID=X6LY52_RETFI|nr:hypothetical protein RFI_30847 [Reticulomyxa filosa]|eukprot:ETO06544.1 hypothetical protein RFI_30847 [Reticulomyxa filosa]
MEEYGEIKRVHMEDTWSEKDDSPDKKVALIITKKKILLPFLRRHHSQWLRDAMDAIMTTSGINANSNSNSNSNNDNSNSNTNTNLNTNTNTNASTIDVDTTVGNSSNCATKEDMSEHKQRECEENLDMQQFEALMHNVSLIWTRAQARYRQNGVFFCCCCSIRGKAANEQGGPHEESTKNDDQKTHKDEIGKKMATNSGEKEDEKGREKRDDIATSDNSSDAKTNMESSGNNLTSREELFQSLQSVHPHINPHQPLDLSHLSSCFVVFASQSQATKCVKDRSRSDDGIRAMHRYDYNKMVKKYKTAELKGEAMPISPPMRAYNMYTFAPQGHTQIQAHGDPCSTPVHQHHHHHHHHSQHPHPHPHPHSHHHHSSQTGQEQEQGQGQGQGQGHSLSISMPGRNNVVHNGRGGHASTVYPAVNGRRIGSGEAPLVPRVVVNVLDDKDKPVVGTIATRSLETNSRPEVFVHKYDAKTHFAGRSLTMSPLTEQFIYIYMYIYAYIHIYIYCIYLFVFYLGHFCFFFWDVFCKTQTTSKLSSDVRPALETKA